MKPHRYLAGVSVTALGLGNRLIIRTVKPHTKNLKITRQQVGGALGLALFFSPVLARPVAQYAPTTFTVVLVLWVVVAVVVGNTKAAEELAEADRKAAKERAAIKAEGHQVAACVAGPDDSDDQDDEPQDAPSDDVLYALIRYVAAMSDQGTAAHLSHVLEEGQARGLFDGWKVPDLRAHLEGLGVALVEGKKLTFNSRQRNRLAVLLDALPDTGPGAVPAVVQQAA